MLISSRSSIDAAAVVVAVVGFGLAGVQAHADPQRLDAVPGLTRKCLLHRQRGFQAVAGVHEHGEEPVTGGLHHLAAPCLDRAPHQFVVPGQCGTHRVGTRVPQTGRVCDVGEQERHRP